MARVFCKYALPLIFIAVSLPACEEDEEAPVHNFTYTFEQGSEGWVGGFSDYPSGWDTSRFEFQYRHSGLPSSVNHSEKGLLISGKNISDDLFMFIKKQIGGLKPNRNYLLSCKIELASQYPENSVGIGGSPGGSVYLKAGAATIEPLPVENGGQIMMNIDKGNQAQDGEHMTGLGTIGITGEDFEYQLIVRHNMEQPLKVQTDNSGSIWVILGTDSGFEGTTTLYYNAVDINLREAD